MITINIKTWECATCGYKQDFDPDNHLLSKRYNPGVPTGICPACYTARNPTGTWGVVKMKQAPADRCMVKHIAEPADHATLATQLRDDALADGLTGTEADAHVEKEMRGYKTVTQEQVDAIRTKYEQTADLQ